MHDSWTAQLKNWNHTCVSEAHIVINSVQLSSPVFFPVASLFLLLPYFLFLYSYLFSHRMIKCLYLTTCVSAWFGHSPRTPISSRKEEGVQCQQIGLIRKHMQL